MHILAIDQNEGNLAIIEKQIVKDQHQFWGTNEMQHAITQLMTEKVDVVITNKFLLTGDGTEIMRIALSQTPPAPVIVISHQNTADAMIEALQLGALDYISDPIDPKTLKIAIHRAYERRQMHLDAHIETSSQKEKILGFLQGSSSVMQNVFAQINHCAPFKSTVLITGESGTGKDLVARSIHTLSPRTHEPFVAVNCSAIPRDLVESQLFGHEKGAFTSAEIRQEGLFEAANGGTLFLDEIGDLALEAQAKLLRVLENQQITRLGSTTPTDIDVRVIAATNSNLPQAITNGQFREDLYYRLNVLQIEMPPLKERQVDIPLLVRMFLDRFAQENNMRPKNITEETLATLTIYHWPGNVRELKNVMERMAINTQGDTIEIHHLPTNMQNLMPTCDTQPTIDLTPFIGMSLESVEKMHITQTLKSTQGNRTHAARLLDISIRTLQRKLKEFGQEDIID